MSKKKVGNQMIKYPFLYVNQLVFSSYSIHSYAFGNVLMTSEKKDLFLKRINSFPWKKKSRIQKKKKKVSYANLRVDFWTNQKEKKQTNLSNGV